MANPAKKVRALMEQAAALVHEEELRRALVPLAEAFDRWRSGALTSSALSELIHRFHQGESRRVFADARAAPELFLASAITRGVLPRESVAPEVLTRLESALALFAERSRKSE